MTATIGFVDGRHEIEVENISRSRITPVSALTHIGANGASPRKPHEIKPDYSAYLVEIRRGNVFVEVLIDAVTGQILSS